MSMPIGALEDLICCLCENYLSIFPVYRHKLRSEHVCGRCATKINKKDYIRQYTYEQVAQYLKFPCGTDNTCPRLLTPQKMARHENDCSYKIYHCPFDDDSNQCAWIGKHYELFSHYQQHFKYFGSTKNDFKLRFSEDYKKYFGTFDNEVFIFRVKYGENKLMIRVTYVGMHLFAGDYVYTVKIQNYNKNLSLEIIRPVDAGHGIYFETDIGTAINLNKLQWQNGSFVFCYFDIMKKCEQVPHMLQPLDLLKNLECPICLNYMLPPIMQCVNGHSFCEFCKSHVKACPMCRGEINGARNFTLEKFAQCLTYPCKYEQNNCTVKLLLSDKYEHEAKCKFRRYDCPIVTCTWTGILSEIPEHIKSVHKNAIFNSESPTVTFLPGQDSMHIGQRENDIFVLFFKHADSYCYWYLQAIVEEFYSYLFELDFGRDEFSEKLLIRKECGPYTTDDVITSQNYPYIQIKEDQLKNLLVDDKISCRIRVFKKVKNLVVLL